MTDIMQSKQERIDKEMKRLRKILKDIPKDRMSSVTSLLRNAAFMTVTLEDLQMVMVEQGVTSEYKHGENQYGTKKSPEVEIYNTMVKNHMTIMKQLVDLLPAGEPNTKKDMLLEFLKR